ncbi:hypothetical protein ABGB14_49235 [Nonomuraea sp. B10E15]|uniref:GTP pyrophosphokinase n=1 Tax=Nonomuraea sp. B10E15 TaxID=3153560 RepID=UPI00325EDFA9
MDIDAALEKYAALQSRYEKAVQDVKEIIEKVAGGADIKCRISGRAKDPASFQKKAIIKQYADPWSMMTDKAGVRVVVERHRHVDDLKEALKNSGDIEVLHIDDKRQTESPDKLTYSGVHLQVAAPLEEGDSEEVQCEVQIRTVAQDAWSVVSHSLLYKPALELPEDHKRAIYRLVALVEIFDEEVQRVLDAMTSIEGYELTDIIEAAENEYLSLAHSTSRRDFSVYILSRIISTIPDADRSTYPDRLKRYVQENRNKLKYIYERMGPKSGVASEPTYALFGQAESLVLLERLEAAPHLLIEQWKQAGLPRRLLQTLVDELGLSIEIHE